MKSRKGVTLVEILVVVGVLALLAAIAIPNLLRAKVSANEASAKATLKAISNSLENYAILNNTYPANTNLLIGASPPYLNVDFFDGAEHNGYTFTATTLVNYAYLITADPLNSNSGTTTFTVVTGGVLSSP